MTLDIYLPKFDISVPNPPKRKPPKIYIPYTYWLYLIPEDRYYYGCQYRWKSYLAHPAGFWNRYFTSCKAIRLLRKKYDDERDWRFKIDRFFHHAVSTKAFEDYVLNYFDAANDPRFINEHNGDGFVNFTMYNGSEIKRDKNPLYKDGNYEFIVELLKKGEKCAKIGELVATRMGRTEPFTKFNIESVRGTARREGLLMKAKSFRAKNILYQNGNYELIQQLYLNGQEVIDIVYHMSDLLSRDLTRDHISGVLDSAEREGLLVRRRLNQRRFLVEIVNVTELYELVIQMKKDGKTRKQTAKKIHEKTGKTFSPDEIRKVIKYAQREGKLEKMNHTDAVKIKNYLYAEDILSFVIDQYRLMYSPHETRVRRITEKLKIKLNREINHISIRSVINHLIKIGRLKKFKKI